MRKLILEMDEDMPGSDLFVFCLTWIQKMKAETFLVELCVGSSKTLEWQLELMNGAGEYVKLPFEGTESLSPRDDFLKNLWQ